MKTSLTNFTAGFKSTIYFTVLPLKIHKPNHVLFYLDSNMRSFKLDTDILEYLVLVPF